MNNYTDNNPEIKQISKTTGCIIAIIGLLIFLMFMIPFGFTLVGMYNNTPLRGKIALFVILFLIVCFVIVKVKKLSRLHEAIESCCVIRKKVKIIDFSFANENGEGDDTTHGYYVVASDGQNDYDGMFHRGATIIGKPEDEIKKDKFYKENGITLDLKNRDIVRKQLDQRISEIELKMPDVGFIKKGKLRVKIGELKNKKNDLEPYHLHTHEGDFYIGDEYIILIDPDDPSNYMFEKDSV